MRLQLFILGLLIMGGYCQEVYEKDPYSHFQFNNYVIKHQYLDWNVDLENETIHASINYTIETISEDSVLKLDIWNIEYVADSAQITYNGKTTKIVKAEIKKDITILGQAFLDIAVAPDKPKKGELIYIYLEYEITNNSKSVTWFTQNGLDGKPYKGLFTQSKAIYARGLFPTQDSPQVRFTWEANIDVIVEAQEIIMPAYLISKSLNSDTNITSINYKQTQITPAHGFGLWIDNYQQQQISTEVIAYINTKEVTSEYLVDYFSDTIAYINYLESYLKQPLNIYQKNKVTIIIGPHFAPLGGDEYPGIVVLSEDILPVDKKNTLGKSVLVNAIARIWFSYQIVPKRWNCQFLSYGLSTYLERQIIKNVHDTHIEDQHYQERSTLGNDSLYLFVQRTGVNSTKTVLVPKIDDLEDPIELINIVTYEKGYQFFSYIEQSSIGPALLQTFIGEWLKNNTGKIVDDADFKTTLHQFINDKFRASANLIWLSLDIDSWLTKPGMVAGLFRETLRTHFKVSDQEALEETAHQFLHLGGHALPLSWRYIQGLGVNKQLIFLNYFLARIDQLNDDPDTERMLRVLDLKYSFSKSKEQQILIPWITLGLSTDYDEDVIELAEKILKEASVQTFVIPFYEALIYSDKTQVAQTLYDKHKHLYHNLVSSHIERILRDADDENRPKIE